MIRKHKIFILKVIDKLQDMLEKKNSHSKMTWIIEDCDIEIYDLDEIREDLLKNI